MHCPQTFVQYYYYMKKYIIYLEGNIGYLKSTLISILSNNLKKLLYNTNLGIYEYPEALHIWTESKHSDNTIITNTFLNSRNTPIDSSFSLSHNTGTVYELFRETREMPCNY